jgi:hypothetical protein
MSTGVAAAQQRSPVEEYPGQRFEGLFEAFGPSPGAHHSGSTADRLRYWNQVAIDSSGLDHTPVEPGEDREFGHQLGPGRSARAMAIVHIAMADSVAAIKGGFKRYTGIPKAPSGASVDTAIATAAHNTLVAMFPSHAPRLFELYLDDLFDAPGSIPAKARGILVGTVASAAILVLRANDGSAHAEPLMGVDYITRPRGRCLEAGPDQPAAGRPRRPLGRGQAVRADFRHPVPRTAPARHDLTRVRGGLRRGPAAGW